tara:strand:+ start:8454 stop:8675 length:222 start_codon:yes stop_codon:yes gene_type:complete
MTEQPRFNPGDRVAVEITQNPDVKHGDGGIVVNVRQSTYGGGWYYDVILDTGIKLGNYHEGIFIKEDNNQNRR